MKSEPKSKRSAPRPTKSLEDVGRRMDQELEEFIRWFNNDVVPQARRHSSRALRTAATKLSQFADYMDESKRRK